MKAPLPLTVKVASEAWEFEQVHRLNYQTFVEEIPQHQANGSGVLVDKFDQENTYLICLSGDQLLGMMAVRGCRPFSLDQKLPELDSYLPRGRSLCEIRLLAVDRDHRHGPILRGLLELLPQFGRERGYDLAVISGYVKQLKLYRHMGFVPFGPLIGQEPALFQPMYVTLEAFEDRGKAFLRSAANPPAPVNLLPGPVGVRSEVRRAFNATPVSHRSEAFIADFQDIKQLLCRLVGARRVEILMGTGSLANDAIAAQLSLLQAPGLILSNGEFGNRLVDHAGRLGLSFEVLLTDWGQAFDRAAVTRTLDQRPETKWLWAVHCETSTGVLNDLDLLKDVCRERDIRLCMDCISSIGTLPVDLAGVYLASGVSGKGLGGFPGLSLVFYHHDIAPAAKVLPRYLDLGLYAANAGIPFTHSSNLLYALRAAVARFDERRPFDDLRQLSSWLRGRLRDLGFHIVAADEHASPAVITIALPRGLSSDQVGQELEQAGYLLSYKSEYLLKRNWIQICLMGECSREIVAPLLELLADGRKRLSS